jgi:hypothetical protein
MIDDFKPTPKPAKSSEAPDDDASKTDTPATEDFRTPEDIAASDDINEPAELPEQPDEGDSSDKKWHHKLDLHWPPGKKEWIVLIVLVLVIGGGVAGFLLTRDKAPAAAPKKAAVKVAPKPSTVASNLSGLQVDPAANQRPVTGVMIENSMDARPQSGLSQASVVFEAIAEGGITRFLALFQDTQPTDVGPIRSARPYYAQWVLGFDAGYAHVGGSPQALANIKEWGVHDLDQFANGNAYHRIDSREAPHNVYTGVETLTQLQISKGWTTSKFTGFARTKRENPAKAPTAKSVDIVISGPVYNVHYDYVAASNSYNRSEGGAPHMDAATNTQISPKVVVALVMPYGIEADGYHSTYSTLGSGQMYVFQDGTVTQGTWTKKSNAEQFTFTDAAGKPLTLNPGQTWLTVVDSPGDVTAAP